MLVVGSAFKGYAIEASDGRMGELRDFLFDDRSWKIRWLVIETGTWLSGRKVLVHPSAIRKADHDRQELFLTVNKEQVEHSPSIATDEPVSQQMEGSLYNYYGWDPLWGGSTFGLGGMAYPIVTPPLLHGAVHEHSLGDDGDPHLQSLGEVKGYGIHATDGDIGHVENLLVDDASWGVRYLIVDTKNWWPGKHVLVSPYAVREISYLDNQIRLDITREQIKTSPVWDPLVAVEQSFEMRLHSHYGWPGYGW